MDYIKRATIAFLSAVSIIGLGLMLSIPIVFSGRVLPGVFIGDQYLTGLTEQDLAGVLAVYNDSLRRQAIVLSWRDKQVKHTLADLGFGLNITLTAQRIMAQDSLPRLAVSVRPAIVLTSAMIHQQVATDFFSLIKLPRDATLQLAPNGALKLLPSSIGEGLDLISFEQDLSSRLFNDALEEPIELKFVSAAPEIQDPEVEGARLFAAQILREGLKLSFGEEKYDIKPFSVRRLLAFRPVPDPQNPDNQILAVAFDSAELTSYLATTIAPAIDQVAQDARFSRQDDRVEVFQLPKQGRSLNIAATLAAINSTLQGKVTQATLAVDITDPQVTSLDDVNALGIRDLLASGISEFSGSPRNRVHNITVGVSRYHGLLIPPQTEFSFNDQLGPVTAGFDWKPELVIKNNLTTPEFGGGICQVSTTAFRAAVLAGLKIIERRNHSYAVRYYGKPGFDATIYPGHTDLRFINNTPGYILIQARVEDTSVIFDFWGTNDGREVKVVGPANFDRRPDGAVKATLSQHVTRDKEVMIDDTFYSRYKSPNLFPKAVQTDDPNRAKAGT